jgi:hypothetical protein
MEGIITLIILQIICTSAILYHIYKIKNNLDVQLKDLRYNQNLNNIDIDSNESDKYEIKRYPHKYNVNDLIRSDFKIGKKDDVKRLEDEHLFNGAICKIKYIIEKSDSNDYIVSIVGGYSNQYYYIVPENIIVKLSDSDHLI